MGDNQAPQLHETTKDILASLQDYLPGLTSTINAGVGPTEQAKLAAAQQTSPGYAQLANDLYSKYMPQLSALTQNVDRSNKLASANTDLAVLGGPGQQLAQKATEVAKGIDPEFFKQREQTSNQLSNLFNSINLNGLSGGERAEVERATNAQNVGSGNLGNNNATNTVSNAMNFGNALNQKRDQLGAAIDKATTFLGSSRSGIDPYGRPQTTNADSQYKGVVQPGQEAFQTGNNFLNQIGQSKTQQTDVNANARDWTDKVTAGFAAV